jgi:hypothetical protein
MKVAISNLRAAQPAARRPPEPLLAALMLASFTLGGCAPARAEWQYELIKSGSADTIFEMLSRAGREGWELTTCISYSTPLGDEIACYLKRPSAQGGQ